MRNHIYFRNLRAEMARDGITVEDLGKGIERSGSTVSRKLSRRDGITLKEAFAIQKRFFPQNRVEYLFSELIGRAETGIDEMTEEAFAERKAAQKRGRRKG